MALNSFDGESANRSILTPETKSMDDDRPLAKKQRPSSPSPSQQSFPKNEDRQSLVLGIEEKSQVRLGVEMNLFSRTGDSVPIINVLSGAPFHNLRVRGKVSDDKDVVLENAITQSPVIVIKDNAAGKTNDTFKIYSTHPVYAGQASAYVPDYNEMLYSFADVKRDGEVLCVVLEGQSSPSYVVYSYQKISHPSFPSTCLVFNKLGEEVASSRSGEGGQSYATLTVKARVDPCLMVCLAAISEEANKGRSVQS